MIEDKPKHCTLEDLGMSITGEDAQPLVDACNRYLHDFAGTMCPKCGSKLGGLMGSFTWGVIHGEGMCTGRFSDEPCGWPCRGYHDIRDDDGEAIWRSLPIALAYHPDVVVTRTSEEQD